MGREREGASEDGEAEERCGVLLILFDGQETRGEGGGPGGRRTGGRQRRRARAAT